jgi:hypothetical protein
MGSWNTSTSPLAGPPAMGQSLPCRARQGPKTVTIRDDLFTWRCALPLRATASAEIVEGFRPLAHPVAMPSPITAANALLIRVLSAQAAIAEEDHLPQNIVSEPPAPKGEPILAFPRGHAFQFLDVVDPRLVMRIC